MMGCCALTRLGQRVGCTHQQVLGIRELQAVDRSCDARSPSTSSGGVCRCASSPRSAGARSTPESIMSEITRSGACCSRYPHREALRGGDATAASTRGPKRDRRSPTGASSGSTRRLDPAPAPSGDAAMSTGGGESGRKLLSDGVGGDAPTDDAEVAASISAPRALGVGVVLSAPSAAIALPGEAGGGELSSINFLASASVLKLL